MQLSAVRSELAVLRNDLSVLDIADDRDLHAIALPTFGDLQWRWRVQVPTSGQYRLCYALDQIPESGFTKPALSISSVTRNFDGTPMEGSFVLDVGLHEDSKGVWQFKSDNGPCKPTYQIDNEPAWLDSGSFGDFKKEVFGTNETVSDGEKLMLLRMRRCKLLPNGGTALESRPTDGLLIWLEKVDTP